MTDTYTAPRRPQRPAGEWADDAAAPAFDPSTDLPDVPERLLAGPGRSHPARVILSSGRDDALRDWTASDERVPVFAVERDGEQAVYTMPAKPNPGVMLAFLRDTNTRGEVALAALLERCLGVAAVDALQAELEGMDGDEGMQMMRSISERVQRNLAGGLK